MNLMELTQLELVIEKAKNVTREVDLTKDKEAAIKELQEKYALIAPTLTDVEKAEADKEMEAYYEGIIFNLQRRIDTLKFAPKDKNGNIFLKCAITSKQK